MKVKDLMETLRDYANPEDEVVICKDPEYGEASDEFPLLVPTYPIKVYIEPHLNRVTIYPKEVEE